MLSLNFDAELSDEEISIRWGTFSPSLQEEVLQEEYNSDDSY